jgi:hypothetical protein
LRFDFELLHVVACWKERNACACRTQIRCCRELVFVRSGRDFGFNGVVVSNLLKLWNTDLRLKCDPNSLCVVEGGIRKWNGLMEVSGGNDGGLWWFWWREVAVLWWCEVFVTVVEENG